jgi:diacylglycerol O-acyltransferase 3, plant
MGGKCKKADLMDLLHEFKKKIGGELGGAMVVGCKCMDKCKEGPNVRVSNFGAGTIGTVQVGSVVYWCGIGSVVYWCGIGSVVYWCGIG